MFVVKWCESSRTAAMPVEVMKSVEFAQESDARRYARSLRSDVWTARSCVCLYRDGMQIASSFDENCPL